VRLAERGDDLVGFAGRAVRVFFGGASDDE